MPNCNYFTQVICGIIILKFEIRSKEMNKEFDDYKRYLTPTDVCEILQISKASFYKRVWKGDIITTRLGGSIRVDKRRLEKQLEENTRG